MTFHQLYTFCKVYDYQSFTAAAEHLYIAQSAVSRVIKSLESDLGIQLIDRTKSTQKGIKLTASGETLYATAQSILKAWNEFNLNLDKHKTKLKNQDSFTIISEPAAGTYLLPRLLIDYRTQIGNSIQVKIYITTNVNEIIEAIEKKSYDLAFFPDFPETKNIKAEANFSYKQKLILVANPFFLNNNYNVNLKELPMVLPPKSSSYRKFIDSYSESLNLNLNVAFEISHPESIKKVILTEKMASILTYDQVKEEIEKGLLVQLETSLPDVYFNVAYLTSPSVTWQETDFLSYLNDRLNTNYISLTNDLE